MPTVTIRIDGAVTRTAVLFLDKQYYDCFVFSPGSIMDFAQKLKSRVLKRLPGVVWEDIQFFVDWRSQHKPELEELLPNLNWEKGPVWSSSPAAKKIEPGNETPRRK